MGCGAFGRRKDSEYVPSTVKLYPDQKARHIQERFNGRWVKVSGNNHLGSYLAVRLPYAAPGHDAPVKECLSSLHFIIKLSGRAFVGRWTGRGVQQGIFTGSINSQGKLFLSFPGTSGPSCDYTYEKDGKDDDRPELFNGLWKRVSGNVNLGGSLYVALPNVFPGHDAEPPKIPLALQHTVNVGTTLTGVVAHRNGHAPWYGEVIGAGARLRIHFPADSADYIYERDDQDTRVAGFNGRWFRISGSDNLGTNLIVRDPFICPGHDANLDFCASTMCLVSHVKDTAQGRWIGHPPKEDLDHQGPFTATVYGEGKMRLNFPHARTHYIFARDGKDEDQPDFFNGMWNKVDGNWDLGSSMLVSLPNAFSGADAPARTAITSLYNITYSGRCIAGMAVRPTKQPRAFRGLVDPDSGQLKLIFSCSFQRTADGEIIFEYVFERDRKRTDGVCQPGAAAGFMPVAPPSGSDALGAIARRPEVQGWSLSHASGHASRQLELLLRVADSSQLGVGRDAGLYHRRYKGLKLHGAWRLEHPDLYKVYSTRVNMVMRQVSRLKNQNGMPSASLSSTTDSVAAKLPGTLNAEANEKMLLHACKPENLLEILEQGLSDRLSLLSGAFGAGIYLAEDVAKADQYAVADANGKDPALQDLHSRLFRGGHPGVELFYCLVVRAVCGSAVRTLDGKTSLEDPTTPIYSSAERRELATIKGSSPPVRYHSLVVELGEALKRFREFVIFEHTQCYVEYILAYQRI